MKSTLTLRVTCSGLDADEETIRDLLQRMVEHAANQGVSDRVALGQALLLEVDDLDFTITFGEDPVTALRAVVDSYDDTGCEGCGVIDESVYHAARKALGSSHGDQPGTRPRSSRIKEAVDTLRECGADVTVEPPNPSCHSGQTVITLRGEHKL